MPGIHFLSAVIILFLPVSGFAAAENPGGGQDLLQKRCFCVQYTNALPPYVIGKLIPSPPECAKIKYASNGKLPLENLLSCDDLQKCFTGFKKYEEKRKILNDKTSQAREHLAACCPAGGEEKSDWPRCKNKCASAWERIIRILSLETEKLGA